MGKVNEIYRQNIYGVIATLTFHILLLLVLITSSLESAKLTPEEAIVVDLATPEIKLHGTEKEKAQQAPTSSQHTLSSATTKGLLASNRAVNDAANTKSRSNDPFFDNDYNKEIAAAKKLVNDVNRTLSQEIPKIGDIHMPVDNAEGKTREEVKQSNFKGKSNIHYFLANRFHARLPIPIYLAEGGGEVIVDIVVGRDGHVLSANPRLDPKITDLNILAYSKQAAEKTWFNEDPSAPERQKGTITYLFVTQ